MSYGIYTSHDLQVAGDQIIPVPFLPKSIRIIAHINSAAYESSYGFWTPNLNGGYCQFDMGGGAKNGKLNFIASMWDRASGGETSGAISAVSDTQFTITWSKNGAGASGVIQMLIEVLSH